MKSRSTSTLPSPGQDIQLASLLDNMDIEKGDGVVSLLNVESSMQRNTIKDVDLIDWNGPDDPDNPQNWPSSTKWKTTIALALMLFYVTFASSLFGSASSAVSKKSHIPSLVFELGTSVFILGFAIGPLIWAPLSELFGRTGTLFLAYFCVIFTLTPVGGSLRTENFIMARFMGGFIACGPVALIAGCLTDIFDTLDRGIAVAVFVSAVSLGSLTSSIMSISALDLSVDCCWAQCMNLLIAVSIGLMGAIVVPETSHSLILQSRVNVFHPEIDTWTIYSEIDKLRSDFRTVFGRALSKPVTVFLLLEPTLVMITAYTALAYGILYFSLGAREFSFQEDPGWIAVAGSFPFLGISIGVLLGCVTLRMVTGTHITIKLQQHRRALAEERLPPFILGSALLPIGIFWFTWTSSPHISWVSQAVSGIPIGWDIFMIFMQGLDYMVEV